MGAFTTGDSGVAVATDAASIAFSLLRATARTGTAGYDTHRFAHWLVMLTNVSGTPTSLVRWVMTDWPSAAQVANSFLVRTRMLDSGAAADLTVTQSRSSSVLPQTSLLPLPPA
jgi:hypothetical protein